MRCARSVPCFRQGALGLNFVTRIGAVPRGKVMFTSCALNGSAPLSDDLFRLYEQLINFKA